MSNESQPSGEEPVGDQEIQSPAPDHAAALEGLDQAGLAHVLGFTSTETAVPVPQKESAEIPTAPEETPEAPAEEPPASEEQPEATVPSAESKPPHRISVRSLPAEEQEQLAKAVQMVRDGKAPNVFAALNKLAGPSTAPVAPGPPAGTEQPAPPEGVEAAKEQTPSISDLESALAQLREQRDQADDDYNRAEVRRLTREIEDTVGQIALAKLAETHQQREQSTAQSSYQNDYVAAVEEMEAKFSWATDEESPLYQMLDDKVTAARARGAEALKDPRFILSFAEEINSIGQPATPAPPPPKPTPKPKPPVGGSLAPASVPEVRLSKDQAEHAISNASQEQLSAVLWPSQ